MARTLPAFRLIIESGTAVDHERASSRGGFAKEFSDLPQQWLTGSVGFAREKITNEINLLRFDLLRGMLLLPSPRRSHKRVLVSFTLSLSLLSRFLGGNAESMFPLVCTRLTFL